VKWGGIEKVIGENLRKWQNWVEFFFFFFFFFQINTSAKLLISGITPRWFASD